VHLYHDTFVTIRLLICRAWVFLEDTMKCGFNHTSCFRRCSGIPSCPSMQRNLSDSRHQQHTQRAAQTMHLRRHYRHHSLTAVASDGASSSAPPAFSGPKVCWSGPDTCIDLRPAEYCSHWQFQLPIIDPLSAADSGHSCGRRQPERGRDSGCAHGRFHTFATAPWHDQTSRRTL
jgi:hypothetical protein